MNFKPVLLHIIAMLVACSCWIPRVSGQEPIVRGSPATGAIPDISGQWSRGENGELGKAVIFKERGPEGKFIVRYSQAANRRREPRTLSWSATRECFEELGLNDQQEQTVAWEMKLLPDGKTMRVVSKLGEIGRKRLYEQYEFPDGIQLDKVLNHHWIRTGPFVEGSKDAEDHAGMPDISGTWGVETNVPGVYRTAEVTRSTGGSDFVLRAHIENTVAIQHLRWNAN